MARLSVVSCQNSRTYVVRGRDEPTDSRPAPMILDIDGNHVSLDLLGSQHVAACIAAIAAMTDADARGITHLTIATNSMLLRNHADGRWDRHDALLSSLHQAIEALGKRFERVIFT